METLSHTYLVNPCKGCLLDPICREECKPFHMYINRIIKEFGVYIDPPYNSAGSIRYRQVIEGCIYPSIWLNSKKIDGGDNFIAITIHQRSNREFFVEERSEHDIKPCNNCPDHEKCTSKDEEFMRLSSRYGETNNE